MRISSCIGLGTALVLAVSLSAGAQDQPAAGSPPPGTPAQTQQQTQQQPAAAPAQQAPAQNAAPDDNALPPPPIDARRGPNPHRQAERLTKQLGLTTVQEAQIEPILADRIRRARSIRADATLGPQERRMELREAGRDSVRRISAVLTIEQRQQWKQLRREERAKRMERRQQTLQAQPAAPPTANNQQ